MKLTLHRGITAKIIRLFIQDVTKADGSGLSKLTSAALGLSAYFIREGDSAPTAISMTSGVVGTWSSGGFAEVDASAMPGIYELGLPNAALSAGESTVVMLKGADAMAPCLLEIELDAIDYQQAIPTAAGIKAQVVAALSSDQQSELSVIPSATPTIASALMLIYMALRNQVTATATQIKIRKDDGSVVATASANDDGTTFTRGKFF